MMILKKLAKYLEPMGLSINNYFNMAVRQLVIQKIPFEILAEQEDSNLTTRRALIEAKAKDLGIIPDGSPHFKNVDED
ncbi:damage-inducible protein J [Limosilactobacillus reuteri]|uniref:damage-inducible protein J n=1 Tax=Limosilactobacillus reuteri TaxID=1598 RepID=UPI001E374399|nr:damage-inducible protein J [Limosilactobacillus reuteri]MCC4499565.1 damage-inducible protein J [Limosilactobacillus reuteri]MCC4504598.1 damage-inducible protein J [Limosilactobacillus reuteri]MCC4506765.1 damage-inducible protein J [Limosilactobacillus reuteri]